MRTRQAQVLGTEDDVVREAALALAGGALVAVPTECVYGLAARADDATARRRLFTVKGRAEDKPVARLLADPSELAGEIDPLPGIARRLVTRAWPGPLTLVLRDGAGERRGFRNPDHAVARALVRAAGVPVLATSANRSGRPPAVDAEEVRRDFDGRIEWILDGGPARHRLASTVVAVEGGRWEILRAGVLDREAVADAACLRVLFVCTGNLCRSPLAEGLLRRLLADRVGCAPGAGELEVRGFRIGSAGTAGLPDQPATPEAQEAAAALGADLSSHRSRPLTHTLLDRADRILVMTESQRRMLLEFAWDARDRIRLLDLAGEDIPDPYLQTAETYRLTAERIRRALEPLVEEIA